MSTAVSLGIFDPPTRPDPQLLGGPFHIDIRTDPNGDFQDALDTGAYGAIKGEGFVRRHDPLIAPENVPRKGVTNALHRRFSS